ncbi:hypothetical protein TIFTF001_007361 [Ficus carica]|uniref:Uncharacterized protein n=1 Tax=Ficus carica TaxID=3494 RepID=A0AA87ZRJ7_FICCA|nr:hypothetical protein TIFTF001_007361 [Ficus carica]
MGKIICSEMDDGGLDLSRFLMVIVIVLTLMVICRPPPRRKVFTVHRLR